MLVTIGSSGGIDVKEWLGQSSAEPSPYQHENQKAYNVNLFILKHPSYLAFCIGVTVLNLFFGRNSRFGYRAALFFLVENSRDDFDGPGDAKSDVGGCKQNGENTSYKLECVSPNDQATKATTVSGYMVGVQ